MSNNYFILALEDGELVTSKGFKNYPTDEQIDNYFEDSDADQTFVVSRKQLENILNK